MKTTILLGFFCFLFFVIDLSEGISPPAPPPVEDNQDHVIIENINIAESGNEDMAEVENSEADSNEDSEENSEEDSDEDPDENSEEDSKEDSNEDSEEDSDEDSDEESNLFYTNE